MIIFLIMLYITFKDFKPLNFAVLKCQLSLERCACEYSNQSDNFRCFFFKNF